jgi:hypothetical protein
MNTAVSMEINSEAEMAKNRTLKALFQVICSDNEFSLLRQTLKLYCEELEASTGSNISVS